MSSKILLMKHNDAPDDDRTATHFAARGFELEWRYPFVSSAAASRPERRSSASAWVLSCWRTSSSTSQSEALAPA
jgi:hypothetical protein